VRLPAAGGKGESVHHGELASSSHPQFGLRRISE